MNNKKLVGIFKTENEAIRVIENLKTIGYLDNEISVIAKQIETIERIDNLTNVETKATEDPSKIVGGAAVGGILGGVGALLAELGVLAIPGIGPFMAAGPIAATIAGLVAGGAVVGGLVGVLVDLGIDKEDAKEYETYLNRGDILVAVDKREDTERQIMGYYNDNNSIIRDRYNNPQL